MATLDWTSNSLESKLALDPGDTVPVALSSRPSARTGGYSPSQEPSVGEHHNFKSIGKGGIDRQSFPMRLWEKAKDRGVWNPADFDFAQDRADWLELNEAQREHILQLCSLFQVGEEAVTLDLLPLIHVIASEGRLEEEMYLTSFLWEEAKHLDLFNRFLNEVTGDPGDLSRYFYPGYVKMFCEELPSSLNRLKSDTSPEAQVSASVTYNMIIEGVQAESGYFLFHRMLTQNGLMPAMQKAVACLKADESRHIAFGVYFLSRLIVEHGDRAWNAFLQRMEELKPLVDEQTTQFMSFFEGEHPFGVSFEEVQHYSEQQFAARFQRIEKARGQSLEELHRISSDVLLTQLQ